MKLASIVNNNFSGAKIQNKCREKVVGPVLTEF